MSLFTSNAIVSKCKSVHGYILKENDYLELLKKRSISEITLFLKNHHNYSETLKSVLESQVHRGRLEVLIRENWHNFFKRISKFVHTSDKSFYEINILKLEIAFLLATIRKIMSTDEEIITEIPNYLIKETKLDIVGLTNANSFISFLELLNKTAFYNILYPFLKDNAIKGNKYLEVEKVLEDYYYDHIFSVIAKHYRGSLKKDLEDMFKTRIEISNIIKIYRLKKFYKATKEEIVKTLLDKHSRMSKKKLAELAGLDDLNQILTNLKGSEFSKYSDSKDYVYVEYFGEKIKYNLAKRHMYYSSKAPKVYAAFSIISQIEVDNLTNIVEGIRYQIDEHEIRQMLIY